MKPYLLQRVLLCVLVCVLISCARSSKMGPLRSGRALEEQGDYLKAWEKYQKIQDLGFRNVCRDNLRYLYGDILDAMQALQEHPDSPEEHFALGYAYYEKALSLPPHDQIASNFGFDSAEYFAQQRKQLLADAMTALNSTVQLRQDSPGALFLKGLLYEDTDEPENAIMVYQQLLELQPESPVVVYRLGNLLYDTGQTEKGLELVSKAVERYPEYPGAHFILGVLYGKEGKQQQALDEFHQTLCAGPHYIEAYYRIAQIFLQNNNVIDAERVLRLGIQRNPQSLQLGLFYEALRLILDKQEEEEAGRISQLIEGEVTKDMMAVNMSEQPPALQLRYLHLRLKLIQRQRPYLLPCADMQEPAFFTNLITQTQAKIQEVEQVMTLSE